jgi:cell division initiation protein
MPLLCQETASVEGHRLARLGREVEASYERVWIERENLRAQVVRLQAQVRENDKLRAQLERIEPELKELQKVDQLLRGALVSAERTTEKLKQEARTEAETAVRRAHKRAEKIDTRAKSERRRVKQEIEQLEAIARRTKESCRELLTQALEAIDPSAALTTPDEEPKKLPSRLDTSRSRTSRPSRETRPLRCFSGCAPTRAAILPRSRRGRRARSCSRADRSARRDRRLQLLARRCRAPRGSR